MKVLFILFFILPIILYAQDARDKFVGEWSSAKGPASDIRHISIINLHDNYYLTYNTMPDSLAPGDIIASVEFGTLTYQLKDNYLWCDNDTAKITLVGSGHVMWRRIEWERAHH